MDHLSSMKRKNVVLVYDLLLEMLDANTSGGGSSQPSSSPSTDSLSDQQQYPQHPSHLQSGLDHSDADHASATPAEAQTLDRYPQAPPLQSSPPFQSLVVAHMDANE